MSYTTNSAKDGFRKEMFVVLRPRYRPTSFTLFSGSTYYASFDFGPVTALSINGTALTEGTSTTLFANQWYYSESEGRIYFQKSVAPTSTDWIVLTFEVYLSTFDTVWYSAPTDSSTDEVNFRGIIIDPPVIAQSDDQNIFGYSPVQDTSITCTYDAEYLQEMLYDITFNKAEVIVYHMAGDLDTANITKIFTGVGGTHSVTDDRLQINILDKSYLLDAQMDNGGGNYFSTDTTTDPNYRGRAIPSYYGPARSFRGVCIDYDDSSPTTSQNRKWAFFSGEHFVSGGTTPDYTSVTLFKDGTGYSLTKTTHYSSTYFLGDAENTFGVTLVNNVEALLGISTINPSTDYVQCSRVSYEITQTKDGSAFDVEAGLPTVSRVLYHILKTRLNLGESQIDLDSFTTVAATETMNCDVMIPQRLGDDFPSYREVIAKLCATGFLRSFFTTDGKFKIKAIAPAAGTADLSLTDDDLIDVRFEYDTNDIHRVRVTTPMVETVGVSKGGFAVQYVQEFKYDADYDGPRYLHNQNKFLTVDTYGYDSSFFSLDTTFIDKYGQLLGDRRGLLFCFVKSGAYSLELGDTVSISRKKQPGFAYDGETENERSFVVTQIRKQIDGVYLVLDDQKSIEENSGDW